MKTIYKLWEHLNAISADVVGTYTKKADAEKALQAYVEKGSYARYTIETIQLT